jgi:DNA-binding NarL/FixJ family response regulator
VSQLSGAGHAGDRSGKTCRARSVAGAEVCQPGGLHAEKDTTITEDVNTQHDVVRVLLVEDHEMVARGLQAALVEEPDLEVIALASTVVDGVNRFSQLRPDVVVMDYRLPDGEGTEATRQIREVDDDAPVLLLTGADDPSVVSAALDAGCSGFVSKDRGVDELASAIRAVARGAAVFPAGLLARALSAPSTPASVGGDLTGREREVLTLLAAGNSTEEIGGQLFLSLHTVRNHVRNILTKLHARTKLEAVVVAARAGIVDLRPES